MKRQSILAGSEASGVEYLAFLFQNSNRDTLGNRNRRNQPDLYDLIFSNRDKIGGVVRSKSEQFANLHMRKRKPLYAEA